MTSVRKRTIPTERPPLSIEFKFHNNKKFLIQQSNYLLFLVPLHRILFLFLSSVICYAQVDFPRVFMQLVLTRAWTFRSPGHSLACCSHKAKKEGGWVCSREAFDIT
jgi:hypothetical protein